MPDNLSGTQGACFWHNGRPGAGTSYYDARGDLLMYENGMPATAFPEANRTHYLKGPTYYSINAAGQVTEYTITRSGWWWNYSYSFNAKALSGVAPESPAAPGADACNKPPAAGRHAGNRYYDARGDLLMHENGMPAAAFPEANKAHYLKGPTYYSVDAAGQVTEYTITRSGWWWNYSYSFNVETVSGAARASPGTQAAPDAPDADAINRPPTAAALPSVQPGIVPQPTRPAAPDILTFKLEDVTVARKDAITGLPPAGDPLRFDDLFADNAEQEEQVLQYHGDAYANLARLFPVKRRRSRKQRKYQKDMNFQLGRLLGESARSDGPV